LRVGEVEFVAKGLERGAEDGAVIDIEEIDREEDEERYRGIPGSRLRAF
jgi:hypothetical protein